MLAQHEVGVRNLEILNNTTDARGRKLEVVKVHCPPPLFRTYREAEGVDVSPPSPLKRTMMQAFPAQHGALL